MPTPTHQRSISHESAGVHSPPPRSPSPLPSQTFHPSHILHSVPTPALVESVAGGAHYSGVRVDAETRKRRRSSVQQSEVGHISPDHQRVLDDLKELYCGRPTLEIFERSWREDAVFEDPWVKCTGYEEIAAQFFLMPKLYSLSQTLASRVMSSTTVPNRLIYWQKQEYTDRFFGRKKIVESIIVVDLDEDQKIVQLVDQWEGKDIPSTFPTSLIRFLNAKLTPWFVRVPKYSS